MSHHVSAGNGPWAHWESTWVLGMDPGCTGRAFNAEELSPALFFFLRQSRYVALASLALSVDHAGVSPNKRSNQLPLPPNWN